MAEKMTANVKSLFTQEEFIKSKLDTSQEIDLCLSEIVECLKKIKKKDFQVQIERISANTFLPVNEKYHVANTVDHIIEMVSIIEKFYESHLRTEVQEYKLVELRKNAQAECNEIKKADLVKEAERMYRIALVFELIGLSNGIDFPEKEKIKLNLFKFDSDELNHLNLIYYCALVLTMPPALNSYLEIKPEFKLTIHQTEKNHFLDFALIRKRDNRILYDIECDGWYHNTNEQQEKDMLRQKEIEKEAPNCTTVRVPKKLIAYCKGKETPINTALEFWNTVMKDKKKDIFYSKMLEMFRKK